MGNKGCVDGGTTFSNHLQQESQMSACKRDVPVEKSVGKKIELIKFEIQRLKERRYFFASTTRWRTGKDTVRRNLNHNKIKECY